MISRFDSNNSSKRGSEVEQLFDDCLRKLEFDYEETSFKEQVRHADFRVNLGEGTYLFEVKAVKNKSRWEGPEYDWFTVELKANNGSPGWFYGIADFLAIQHIDCFYIIHRESFVKDTERLISKIVSKGEYVKSASEAYYKLYTRTRFGHDDLITKIEFKYIKENAIAKITYSPELKLEWFSKEK